ncbi:poly-gamma-glutamate hydrolase family protein [Priestia megaterium]
MHHHLTALSIHGYQEKAPIVFLCGKCKRYKGKINCFLEEQGFYIKKVPSNIAGTNNKNIMNDN